MTLITGMENLLCFDRQQLDDMGKVSRLKLINSLSGFKSANLIGTINKHGIENLAIFSSVVHIGSNPPLLGCILRPTTVPRHSYQNLKQINWYTINHIHKDIYRQAHQTSGKYRADISEFDITGLTPHYSTECKAPYVKEANIRIGMQPVEQHIIESNGTLLLVGEIQEVWLPDKFQAEDGSLNIEKAGTVAISGLDGYHETRQIASLYYVRLPKGKQRKDT